MVLSNIRLEALGLILGFILGLGLLIGGIAIILNGKQASGLAVLGGAVGALGVSYIVSFRRGRRELNEKQAQGQNPSSAAKPKTNSSATKGRKR